MRLAAFIRANMELILADWSEFAKTLGPAALEMDAVRLRDHAALMLADIAQDLETPQSDRDEEAKSRGEADTPDAGTDSAAQAHGAGRADDGFSVDEMVAEYRAFRASVLRLWSHACPISRPGDFEDVMRFNEAIDQSLAEALRRFTQDLDRSREMFVAVLGHDLRTPLSAVLMAGHVLRDSGDLAEPHQMLSARVVSSATRMTQMVDDLLDFTRSRLGNGIPVLRGDADLGKVARDAVSEITAANPDRLFDVRMSGNVQGAFDAARLSQVLVNLLSNAVQYGIPTLPVTVSVRGEGDEVILRVQNFGPVIPSAKIAGLFSPYKRLRPGEIAEQNTHNLGLGLYVAERVVSAHHGRIAVKSSATDGTEFTVRLPRTVKGHTASVVG
jgi:signal transduction histidine kinase